MPIVRTGGSRDAAEQETGRIWYAGSTENMGFGDLKDNGTGRGWLEVRITPGADPDVRRRHVPIRAMFRLAHLDGTGLSADEVTDALISRIRDAHTAGAVIGQLVEGVTRDTWALVDVPKVRAAAGDALHYELSVRHRPVVKDGDEPERTGLGEIDVMLQERAASLLEPHERVGALALAQKLVAQEIARSLRGDAGRAAAIAADENEASENLTKEDAR